MKTAMLGLFAALLTVGCGGADEPGMTTPIVDTCSGAAVPQCTVPVTMSTRVACKGPSDNTLNRCDIPCYRCLQAPDATQFSGCTQFERKAYCVADCNDCS